MNSLQWGSLYYLIIQLSVIRGSKELNSTSLQCQENSSQSELNSFLWTLERDPPSYFFGTIHVPYTRVWDYIPLSTKNAFRNAENVYFELDLTDGKTAAALTNCKMLSDGITLSDILSKRLYRRLTRYMDYVKKQIADWTGKEQRGRGIKTDYYSDYQYRAIVGSWQRMKPVWLMLLLNSLTESDVRLFGVPVLDLYLSRQASQWNKKIGAIENVADQCEPLNQLNQTQVIFALDETLRHHEQQRKKSQTMPENEELISHYNCGDLPSILLRKSTIRVDLNSVEDGGQSEMAHQVDDYFRQKLLYNRNQIMAERIEQLLNNNPSQSFFFAVGAGHFLGNNSVIDKLILKDFPIKHTRPESIIPNHSNQDSRYMPAEFSQLDSSAIINQQYIQTIKKLDQAATIRTRPIRHGKKKLKRDKINALNKPKQTTQKQIGNFSELWIRVEEIRQVTDNTKSFIQDYKERQPAPTRSCSTSPSRSSAITMLTSLLLTFIHLLAYTL